MSCCIGARIVWVHFVCVCVCPHVMKPHVIPWFSVRRYASVVWVGNQATIVIDDDDHGNDPRDLEYVRSFSFFFNGSSLYLPLFL